MNASETELNPLDIKYLIVHHSAMPQYTTTFQAIKEYHISKGWGDIGYHYFLPSDGAIMPGRDERVVGMHCKADGMNVKSLGICLGGNFETEVPTREQLSSLASLLRDLMLKYHIPKEHVFGHGEVKGAITLCPGKNLSGWVADYRVVVK